MPDIEAINKHIQTKLGDLGISEVTAVQAAQWLEQAGIQTDSEQRPGKNLRDLLRSGDIVGSRQQPNSRWFIDRVTRKSVDELTENDVVAAVSQYLKNQDYRIESALNTREQGIDIEAVDERGHRYYVEAKGATSSKMESSRFGKPFKKDQVKTHIGVALVMAFQIKQNAENATVAIALPGNQLHKDMIASMKRPLMRSGVSVLFVDEWMRVSDLSD